ncbi:MAG: hypothetical protein E7349_05495 [Clostridiales bacterium]|nr:hypothetical protein [Clostridiales bacterium]
MWVFDAFFEMVAENGLIMLISLLLLIAAATICFFCRDRGFFVAFAVMIVGGCVFVLLGTERAVLSTVSCLVGLCFMAAFVYVLLTCALIIRAVVLRRKKRRAEILRKVQYTLPEKDNSYIRSRLNTALNAANVPTHKEMPLPKDEGVKEDFQADYARKLLAKLQEAPLTKAERLEMQEVSRLFSAYLKKSRWTVEDVRLINDMFSYLLKISAKYAI